MPLPARRRSPRLLGLLVAVLSIAACGPTAHGASPSHRKTQAVRRAKSAKSPKKTSARGKSQTPLPPLPQPTAARPIKILVIGDSLGEDLGIGLRDLLGQQPNVRLYTDAVGSTGLVDTAYYNWPTVLAQELQRDRPELVLALFGGNDALSFDQAGGYVPFGSGLWRRDYGGRVATIMRESRQAGARVVWVGLPVMGPSSVLRNSSMADLNAVYAAEATAYRGVTFLSTWTLFATPAGQYTQDLANSQGRLEIVRDPDGVHIAPPAGTDLIASAVLAGVDASEGIAVCPRTDGMWSSYLPRACLAATAAR